MIRIKRIYESEESSDGLGYFVERLYPRGITKVLMQRFIWLKDAAPTPGLRLWFDHDPKKWDEFKHLYQSELEEHPEVWMPILDVAKTSEVTLFYSSKDTLHNNAVVLQQFLEGKLQNYFVS